MPPTAEIFCLGNELLIGRTVNKNASDISLSLSKIGYKVTRITTVRDELEPAVSAFKEIRDRNPDIICVSGGLGPTFDDIQLQVIGIALNLKLAEDMEATQMVAKRYKVSPVDLPKPGRKMATIPEGGVPLNNSAGAAPGVRLLHNNTTIFCLPGVPKEMRAIMKEEIIPYLSSILESSDKRMVEFGFNVRGVGESSIVETTKTVMSKFQMVNFKSHPRRDESGYWLSLQTYLITNNEKLVKDACFAWRAAIIKNHKVDVSKIKPVFDSEFIPE